MPHPAGLPDIFLDRSLGRNGVPEALRAVGLRVVTLDDHYGVPGGEDVDDVTWLELVAQRGWIAFTKDRRIRTREGWAVRQLRVWCFCLYPSTDLKVQEMAACFLANLGDIENACAKPGPFFYHVRTDKILPQRIID